MKILKAQIIIFAVFSLAVSTLSEPIHSMQENQQTKATRYAKGTRELESRIIVQTERYLKGVQNLLVTTELLSGFEPDYVEFYLDGKLAAIDSEPPFEASIDVGAFTARHSILIIANRERQIATAQEKPAESRPQATGSFKIVITNPLAGNYVVGRTPITVEAEFEDDARLEAVQFYVDDELVGTVGQEPFELIHDFGRKFNERRVSVVAVDNLGRQATAVVATAPLERSTFFIEANVVSLDVIVTDDRGKLVGNLQKENFRVFEDGAEQEIRYFSSEERPLWVGVLIDTSGSMQGAKIRRSVFAAQQFISQMKPADNAMIVTFGPAVNILNEFSSDFDAMIDSIGGIQVQLRSPTPLNQAMFDSLQYFKDRVGRRAMIVISDGADTASRMGPDAVHEAAREADVRIYGIGIREMGMSGGLGRMDDPAAILLRGIADVTGGDSYFPTSTSEFLGIFQTIAAELRAQYSIGYVPPAAEGNKWRSIEVKLDRRGFKARTKKGYYPEGS